MNQQNPSPRDFYTVFLTIAGKMSGALIESWPSSQMQTDVILGKVAPDIAGELGMRYYREYFGIDAIFYHERDASNFPNPNSNWAKYISVAFEHENEYYWVAEEMNRLQIYNAPLSVLMTYPQTEKRGAELLEQYAGIVREADVFRNASTERRQLAIFGYPGPEWKAFVYSDGRFTPLSLGPETSTNI